jgi:pimeloyl-ACP methyl ester carboxylesterase
MLTVSLRTALLALACAVAVASSGCGGTSAATTAVRRPVEPVDRLVPTGHGRLHLHCVGRGATTVVLVAGWDSGDGSWDAVEPGIADHARVCSYAKFGTGTSDPAPTPQTFATQADDLHELLRVAGEPGPYVVLGHSFGGAEAVTFASRHGEEVVGLLLLDASPTTWPATACSVPAFAPVCDQMHDPAADPERLDVFPAFEAVARITSLGDLPTTVVTGAHRVAPGVEPDELARLDGVWSDGQQRWARLSSASKVVTVERTGHHIEVDQPQLVVDEVTGLLPG